MEPIRHEDRPSSLDLGGWLCPGCAASGGCRTSREVKGTERQLVMSLHTLEERADVVQCRLTQASWRDVQATTPAHWPSGGDHGTTRRDTQFSAVGETLFPHTWIECLVPSARLTPECGADFPRVLNSDAVGMCWWLCLAQLRRA